MRLIVLFTWALLIHTPSPAHPLHLSITNITYENGTLNIVMKSFRDDWETGYFHYYGKVIDFTDPTQREKPWFGNYLQKSFRIAAEKTGSPLKLELDTLHLDEDAMTIEMHAVVPGSPNSLYIYNSLLTDIFPDQTNLVIFMFEKKETGIKFDVKKHDAEVILK